MPIEFQCQGCGNTLRVPDEHAGRQAKCPVCDNISQVPMLVEPADDLDADGLSSPRADHVTLGANDIPRYETGVPPRVSSDNPYDSSQTTGRAMMMEPHRGGLILTLGILSIVCCNLLGIAAWVMGNEDLNKMTQGQMDPSGRGLTQAGKILGIVALVLMVVMLLFQVAFVGFRGEF